ncbi:hypothetical protein ACQEUU_02945 [Nonomuraea sp. CA-218870]|uniref:hypothetical protein n=1 Tax=Nonomuraea sp. CA-218870 TaxID=3239998 RepID=UPI003D8C0B73
MEDINVSRRRLSAMLAMLCGILPSAAVVAAPAGAYASATAGNSTRAITASGCAGLAVGPAEVVVSDATRDRLGLTGWPDSGFGVERLENGRYRFHAPDAFGGPAGGLPQRNVVSKGTLDNPLADGVVAASPSREVPAGYKWSGGGPIWRGPDGMILKILHQEKYAGDMFYAELHLGRHDPETGVTTYLGPLVQPTNDFTEAASLGQISDVGTSSLTRIGDYLYVYFPDFYTDAAGKPVSTALSVARAPVSAVVTAAQKGTVVPWRKYHEGKWNSPALGGPSTDLQPGRSMAWAPHVVRMAHGGVAMVAAVSPREVVLSTSPNGISNWSPRVPLFRDPDRYNAYVTVVGTGTDPSVIGNTFYVYNTQFLSSEPNWSNVQLVRHKVTCTAGMPASSAALVRHSDTGGRHRVTTSPVDTAGTYPQFGGIWGLYRSQQPGTHPLYECRRGSRDYFVSKDSDCEGKSNALLHTLGWVHTARPAADSTPLYRCGQPSSLDSYVSILADCESADSKQEGLLGYALATMRTPFSRFYDKQEHWETTDRVTSSYSREKTLGYLENSKKPDTVALYGCSYRVPEGTNHFTSLHADCEGLTKHRLEGYVYSSPPADGSMPLYRCYWAPNHDHFLSTEADCEGAEGARNEGRLGYVATTPGFGGQ